MSSDLFLLYYTRRSNALWRGSGVARASPGATYIVRTQAHRGQTALEALPPTLRCATRGCRARIPAASRFSVPDPGTQELRRWICGQGRGEKGPSANDASQKWVESDLQGEGRRVRCAYTCNGSMNRAAAAMALYAECRCRVYCARERRVKRASEVRKGHKKFMAERIEARTHA